MRWPLLASRRGAAAEAQAAMIWLTGRGSPAEDSKTSRPAMPVNGVCPPGLSQSKPHTPRAERRRNRRSVVTSAHALLTFAHEAMGLAESPAFRAPLDHFRGWNASWDYGRARAVTTTGPAELCSFFPSPARCFYYPPHKAEGED